MGEMRLTLGLSGWTANDWTHGSALDLLAPPTPASAAQIESVAHHLQKVGAQPFEEIARAVNQPAASVASALKHLAHTGQLIADLDAGLFRWRQIMPRALGEAELGPENAEFSAMHDLLIRKRAVVESTVAAPSGGFIFTGTVDTKPVEVLAKRAPSRTTSLLPSRKNPAARANSPRRIATPRASRCGSS